MSDNDYFNGALISSVVTMIAALMTFLAVREVGKAECEQGLPRAQQCELKWVKPSGDNK